MTRGIPQRPALRQMPAGVRQVCGASETDIVAISDFCKTQHTGMHFKTGTGTLADHKLAGVLPFFGTPNPSIQHLRGPIMQQLLRIGAYAWPYRRRLFLSVACAVLISALWSLNLSITFPIVRVLFENDSLHANADREIAALKTEIADYRQFMDNLEEGSFAEQARVQKKLNYASQRLVMQQWIRDAVLRFIPEDKFRTILLILGMVIAATIFKGIFVYMQELLVGGLVNATANDIRSDVFSNALDLDTQTLASVGTSNLTSRLTNDVNELSLGLRLFGADLVREPLKALLCIIAAFWFNWRLTLVGILVLPLIGIVFHRSGKALRRSARQTLETVSSIYHCISEALESIRIVIAFGGQDHHRKQLRAANQEYYDRSMKVVQVSALIRPVTELLGMTAFIMILMPGAYMVLNDTNEIAGIRLSARPLEMAELATLYALLAGVLDPLRKMSGIFPILRRSLSAADRVFEVIDLKSSVPETKHPVELSRHSDSIAFENVSFHYQSSDKTHQSPLTLRDISLKIRFGEVIALVGGNGSGKSTLTSLIPRLMDPTEGCVRIDGMDVRDVSTADLRSQIGIVTQDTMLFDDTVYNNVLYGRPDADHSMVEEAIRLSHASDFVSMLPEGLNTRIGPRGQRLSGGQKQRLSLARAILRDPPIMILDEATSAIDAESEAIIYKVLRQFAKGRTVFIITHVINQTFLDLIDRVVVLDRGRIVAAGTHAELSKSSPDYLRLVQQDTQLRNAA